MNDKEAREIRRRFKPDKTWINAVHGCYVNESKKVISTFRESVQTWPEVVECASLTGEMDYLLQVVVSDMAHYIRFIMDTLLQHPSVQDCKTSFVLDRVKGTTSVPL